MQPRIFKIPAQFKFNKIILKNHYTEQQLSEKQKWYPNKENLQNIHKKNRNNKKYDKTSTNTIELDKNTKVQITREWI